MSIKNMKKFLIQGLVIVVLIAVVSILQSFGPKNYCIGLEHDEFGNPRSGVAILEGFHVNKFVKGGVSDFDGQRYPDLRCDAFVITDGCSKVNRAKNINHNGKKYKVLDLDISLYDDGTTEKIRRSTRDEVTTFPYIITELPYSDAGYNRCWSEGEYLFDYVMN